MPHRMTPQEWALLVTLSIVWGASFFFSKVAVADIPPLTLAFGRAAIAAIALIAAVAWSRQRIQLTGKMLQAFVIMGTLNNALPFSLIFWAQQSIPAGLASILNATTPFFAVFVAHAFTTDEKASPRKLLGIVCGIAGVAALTGQSLTSVSGATLWAQGACLAAALSYAVAGVFGRRFRALPALIPAAGQLCASTLLMLPIMSIVDHPWTLPMPSLESLAALGALALVSTTFAYVLYFRLLATAGATNLLLVTMLIPVSAILLAALFLNEHLELREYAGMAIIIAGLIVVDGRLIAALPRAVTWRRAE